MSLHCVKPVTVKYTEYHRRTVAYAALKGLKPANVNFQLSIAECGVDETIPR
jgi:hypothetical protein